MNRVFNRLPQFDEKSRRYNIADLLATPAPRSYTWACAANLDQGQEGACVGFAWTHERAARPSVAEVDEAQAFALYHVAQTLDEWPGEDYQGTSVLAGAKAAQTAGWIGEYRWAFSTQDALAGVSRHGPAVLGITWRSDMWNTDSSGTVHATGSDVGGHAILMRGVDVRRERVLLHNSWSASWGGTGKGPGTAWLSFEDLDTLLRDQGECCIPVVRRAGYTRDLPRPFPQKPQPGHWDGI